MKSINLLGSTGSIGTQALDVIKRCGYSVSALAVHSNITLLEQQARCFSPSIVAVIDEKAAADLKIKLKDTSIRVLSGLEGVCEAARADGEITLNAIVGIAGLRPTLSAIEAKKTVALANKETLVAGGSLVMSAAKKNNISILPIDSEHSAVFQCLQGAPPERALKRVILTASGGPFFGKSRKELESVKAEDALKHPNWEMGAKITIDSATMFNKGLELIEAVWLFDIEPSNIDIVVHRESIVHSLIEFDDNSVIAQMGYPDMRLPIQYALTFPKRYRSLQKQLNLADVGTLSFYKPDYDTFIGMDICRKAITKGGLYPAAANSANEQANLLFRQGKISFLQIGDIVQQAAFNMPYKAEFTAEDIENTDVEMRNAVNTLMR
ncbi:MAG: 1-deoxy-D-xylulose-5-phosphate reductoisomerase [Clostridiales bacterium]|jgi:1-deoxy-D-xylulose-5-phosphate reductoisomerase|nr:1-deoxy-D-xylulose-5-phosphate reductoisomerase [Clostridiales bacterium]